MLIAIALAIKAIALGFAAYDSVRARFWPGIGALATAAYLTLARLASVVPPYPGLPLKESLERTWWIYPCTMFFLSLGPMMFAFRQAGLLPEDDPQHKRFESVGFAFLANTIWDAIVLVLIAVGLLLIARDA